MKNFKKWFSIIYVFFLITLISFFWIVVLNKQLYFQKSLEFFQIEEKLLKNILTNWKISIDLNIENNLSWSLYIPILSCPEEVKYFSWEILLYTWKTIFENNFCSWSLNWENLKLYYTWDYNNFWSWILWLTWFELNWDDILTWGLAPNYISFEKPNNFDDRFIKSRTEIIWNIVKWTWWKNIFWNNTQINDFISTNTNNKEPFLRLWNTWTWILFFDISWSFSWKIIEFDKNLFDNNNKLLKINEFDFLSSTWVKWYLENNWNFSESISNPKKFDFINKDYAIFLSYNDWGLESINYTLKIFSETWTWVYINPIKDDSDKIEYLWNNILIYNKDYYNKIYKIQHYK